MTEPKKPNDYNDDQIIKDFSFTIQSIEAIDAFGTNSKKNSTTQKTANSNMEELKKTASDVASSVFSSARNLLGKTVDKVKEFNQEINESNNNSIMNEKMTAEERLQKEKEAFDKLEAYTNELKTKFSSTKNNEDTPSPLNNVSNSNSHNDEPSTLADDKGTTLKKSSIVKLEKAQVKTLFTTVSNKVFGQDEALNDVIDVLKTAVVGLNANKKKPQGCYLLLGPSGVGKTETVVQIAEHLQIPLYRFDMAEYSAENDVKKLIGSPPGYVGYEDGGQLTNRVAQTPTCVVLFDEIEKAHESLSKIQLGMLDAGILTDNQGNKVYFNNVIFFATSNLGANIEYIDGLTKEEKLKLRLEAVKEKIAPEIINRFDGTIQFNSITPEIYKKIAGGFLDIIIKNFKEEQKIDMTYTDKMLDFITEKSFDKPMGARPARRFIEKIVLKEIVNQIFDDKLEGYDTLTMDMNDKEQIIFKHKDNVISVLENTKELVNRFIEGKFSEQTDIEKKAEFSQSTISPQSSSLNTNNLDATNKVIEQENNMNEQAAVDAFSLNTNKIHKNIKKKVTTKEKVTKQKKMN